MKRLLILSKTEVPTQECLDVMAKCALGGAMKVTCATIVDPDKDHLLVDSYDAVSYFDTLGTGVYGKAAVQTVIDAFHTEHCPTPPIADSVA